MVSMAYGCRFASALVASAFVTSILMPLRASAQSSGTQSSGTQSSGTRDTAQSLAKVNVTATKTSSGNNPRIGEFDERRKMGFGRFLTQDVFVKAEGRKLGDVLSGNIPGLRTMPHKGGRVLMSSRGVASFKGPPRCYVQIIVDDIVRYSTGAEMLFDIDQIDPANIAATEYYTVAQLPQQFNRGGNAPCGTLVIWTRY